MTIQRALSILCVLLTLIGTTAVPARAQAENEQNNDWTCDRIVQNPYMLSGAKSKADVVAILASAQNSGDLDRFFGIKMLEGQTVDEKDIEPVTLETGKMFQGMLGKHEGKGSAFLAENITLKEEMSGWKVRIGDRELYVLGPCGNPALALTISAEVKVEEPAPKPTPLPPPPKVEPSPTEVPKPTPTPAPTPKPQKKHQREPPNYGHARGHGWLWSLIIIPIIIGLITGMASGGPSKDDPGKPPGGHK